MDNQGRAVIHQPSLPTTRENPKIRRQTEISPSLSRCLRRKRMAWLWEQQGGRARWREVGWIPNKIVW